MKLLHFRRFAMVTLAIFVSSLVMAGFSAQSIGHELAHSAYGTPLSGHEHDGSHHHHQNDDDLAGTPALGDAEHNLLHASALIQPAALPVFAWQLPAQDSACPAQLIPPKVAHATREPPFRPPRPPQS